jgi:hypothetical protein
MSARLDDLSITPDPRGACFIKLDIEGAEIDALKGMRGFVERERPFIACAGYHSARQLWEVPVFLSQVLDDASLFVRHYTESYYETVFFLAPNERLNEVP